MVTCLWKHLTPGKQNLFLMKIIVMASWPINFTKWLVMLLQAEMPSVQTGKYRQHIRHHSLKQHLPLVFRFSAEMENTMTLNQLMQENQSRHNSDLNVWTTLCVISRAISIRVNFSQQTENKVSNDELALMLYSRAICLKLFTAWICASPLLVWLLRLSWEWAIQRGFHSPPVSVCGR